MADTIETTLEVATEHNVFRICHRIGPYCCDAPDQPSYPVGGLECLVTVTFQVNGRFDKMSASVLSRIHVLRRCGEQLRAPRVFVEEQGEVVRSIVIVLAEVIDSLDCFEKHSGVQPIWAVRVGCGRLSDTNIEYEAAESVDLIEQPIRKLPELHVLGNISGRVEPGTETRVPLALGGRTRLARTPGFRYRLDRCGLCRGQYVRIRQDRRNRSISGSRHAKARAGARAFAKRATMGCVS